MIRLNKERNSRSHLVISSKTLVGLIDLVYVSLSYRRRIGSGTQNYTVSSIFQPYNGDTYYYNVISQKF